MPGDEGSTARNSALKPVLWSRADDAHCMTVCPDPPGQAYRTFSGSVCQRTRSREACIRPERVPGIFLRSDARLGLPPAASDSVLSLAAAARR